ncbi:MAG: TlyA family RNA methyltransferase [Clostridia bacterium]|nr:TlyA family RNA methyltransferase [Clostridia bacterium]
MSESELSSSRSEAKRLISEGLVLLDGKPVIKPSLDVDGMTDRITILKADKAFVGRGGLKLDHALDHFGISVEGKRCLDIGASSGGFTDCLLQRGAIHVISLDSGSGQLVERLRRDERVSTIENYNARYLSREDLEYIPELCVMDVSFISATYIIPALSGCIDNGAEYVLLIKPQFEVGRDRVGKGGIVKSESARADAKERVTACAEAYGFEVVGVTESPIKGGDGNTEYLCYMVFRGRD